MQNAQLQNAVKILLLISEKKKKNYNISIKTSLYETYACLTERSQLSQGYNLPICSLQKLDTSNIVLMGKGRKDMNRNGHDSRKIAIIIVGKMEKWILSQWLPDSGNGY